MRNETGTKMEQPTAEQKETEPKIEQYGNKYLDEKRWHPYINEWLEYVKTGGMRKQEKEEFMSRLKQYESLDEKKAEEKIESELKDYIDEQERIAQKIAEILEKFSAGKLRKDELEKNIPQYFDHELNAKNQVHLKKYTPEQLVTYSSWHSANMWIYHFLGNYIQKQIR